MPVLSGLPLLLGGSVAGGGCFLVTGQGRSEAGLLFLAAFYVAEDVAHGDRFRAAGEQVEPAAAPQAGGSSNSST